MDKLIRDDSPDRLSLTSSKRRNAKCLCLLRLLGGNTVDLSPLGAVTPLELVEITDPYGLAWDDFSFDFPD